MISGKKVIAVLYNQITPPFFPPTPEGEEITPILLNNNEFVEIGMEYNNGTFSYPIKDIPSFSLFEDPNGFSYNTKIYKNLLDEYTLEFIKILARKDNI